MRQRSSSRWMILFLAALAVCVGLGWRMYRKSRTVFPLAALEQGRYYEIRDGELREIWDPEWSQLMLDFGNQLYEMEQFSFKLSEDRDHEAVFLDAEGNVIRREQLPAGSYRVDVEEEMDRFYLLLTPEEEAGLELTGYLPESRKRQSPFAGKSVSVIGDSISTYAEYIPTGYYTQYPAGDVELRDMWWYRLAKNLGMDLCRINACAGSGITDLSWKDGGVPGLAASEGRGKNLHLLGEKPDMVFVWIGGNDILSGVSLEAVSDGYRSLHRDIRETYPRAELYFCTYLSDVPEIRQLNEEIRNLAKECGANLIELEHHTKELASCFIDESHPNQKGFRLLTAWMTEELSR